MNIDYTEVPFTVVAKTCSCKDRKRKVSYLFLDAYHNLCMDKKDIVSAQLEACERLLKYARDQTDKNAIEKEIAELKMALDLMP